MRYDRVLELEGVHNFRDFGGYAVSGGGRLRKGLLWRSGQHYGATDDDLAQIAAIGLADVFDLRSSIERETHPCRRPAGFAAAIYLSDDPQPHAPRIAAPHMAAAEDTSRQRDAASTREGMRRNYGAIAFRPELIVMMRQQLAVITEGRGPSLVNCMAGKDRTGIAVAMIQLAAGVHRDDIIADYLLTNTAGDVEARIAAGADTIKATARAMDPEVVRVIMGVEPEYMESAFAMIAEKHGSVDGYLREVLGLDDALRERLREHLVED
ncbi:MAG: tyrosine-protein phosphatase [Novosphingobium sp.]